MAGTEKTLVLRFLGHVTRLLTEIEGRASALLINWPLYGPLGARNTRRNIGRMLDLNLGQLERTLLDVAADAVSGYGRNAVDSFSSVLTIHCVLRSLEPALPASPVVGLLEWGADGASQRAEFDFVDGAILQVAGSAARVSVRYEPAAVAPQLRVGAFVGYMPISRGGAARSFPLANMAVPNLVTIPVAAHRMRVLWPDTGPPPFPTFTWFADVAGASLISGPHQPPGGASGGAGTFSVPIPNRARSVIVSLGPVAPGSVIFDLSF